MKSVTIKASDVRSLYNVINSAKYNGLDDVDKIRMWKIARLLKPIASKLDEMSMDAAEKFKPENFDENLLDAQAFERAANGNGSSESSPRMTPSEYESFIGELKNYDGLVRDAVKDYSDEMKELCFEPLSESAFEKLLVSNDWSLSQAVELSSFMVG